MNVAFVLLAVVAGLLCSNEIRSSAFVFPHTSSGTNRIHGKNDNINRFVSYSTRTSSAFNQSRNASLPPSKIVVTSNNIGSNPKRSSTTITTRTRRHPRGYWADINNIRTEILAFWSSLSIPIPISEQSKPPIPNESLLNHFLRHDLRYGIASHGGREVVSYRLGGARVMPGKWKEAVLTRELRLLLDQQQQQKKRNDGDDGLNVWEPLSEEIPPVPPQEKNKKITKKLRLIQSRLISNKSSSLSSSDVTRYNNNTTTISTSNDGNITSILQIRNVTRWKHREGRRKWGYWDKQNVLDELHTFLVDYGKHHNQPSIWMPRMSELSAWGRKDLYSAIIRFYGRDKSVICDAAGLIPSNEWEYFQSLHDLILELLIYLKQRKNNHHINPQEQREERAKLEHGEELVFPPLSEIREHASPKLYSLIQRHGGRKLVARRFNMRLSLKQKSKQTNTAARTAITSSSPVMDDLFEYSNYECLSWGSFSLQFALELLSCMRTRMLRIQQQSYSQQGHNHVKYHNPMSLISMPTKKELARTSDGMELANKIEQYGGFENVARRLGLLWNE